MRVPVLVPIGPHLVSVRYAKALDDNDYGAFCPETQQISVSKSRCASPDDVFKTCFHEMLHAALWFTGWGRYLTPRQEEAVVTALEFCIGPLIVFSQSAKGIKWREVKFPFEG